MLCEPKKVIQALTDPSWIEAMQEELLNKKNERGIVVRNKARLVAQGYTQEEGIDYNEFLDKVFKVEKDLYGLHQAPRAWYETLSTYLLENRYRRGTIDKNLFIKKDIGDILLVQLYVDDIIFGSTKKVQQKEDGIFISQDKYVVDIFKKFDFTTVKAASTLIETNKALNKDEEAEDVDVHLYRSMIRSLMYLTASRPDIIFTVCACARFQVTPKTSYLYVVKRIFRYLKGQPKLGLWYPKDSPFDLEAFFIVIMLELALTGNPQQEGVNFLAKDETVYKEWDDRMERAATTASSLKVEQDSVNILRSGEDSMKLIELMEHCTKMSELKEALMGYESDSDKLTFQKALFSPQWNTPTILQSQGKALQEDTQLPQTSVPIPNVADKTVFKERDDKVVRATTTAASLDVLVPRVLALEQSKTTQDVVINKLQKKVKRLENALRVRTQGMKLFKIGTSRRKGLDKNNVSKQGRKSDKTKVMFKDSEFDVLDDAMENVEGGSISKQITTTRDTLNTARIKVSVDGPSTTTIRDIFEDEMTTIADTLVAIGGA
ncbi:putative ribonuclease H-like domain-containing protein [Tanacetum coccineum]|uniref:Ribonuclease H-like domain-containing protein n=1 Tax=Tanacetum coccineum TaxID=301880 RepID=A0ABQ5H2N0_9ASTR